MNKATWLVLAVPGWKLAPMHCQAREWLMMLCMERGINLAIMPEYSSGIDLARNITVAKFLALKDEQGNKPTHLLFVDSDIAFDPENVFTMLDANLDVCGGLYPKKVVDHAAAAKASKAGVPDEELRYHTGQFVGGAEAGSRRSFTTSDGKHRFVDADRLGTGFMLIKREALEKFISFHRRRIEYRSLWEPKGLQHAVFFSEQQGPRQAARDKLLKTIERHGRGTATADEVLKVAREYNTAMEGELDVYQTEDFNFTLRAKEAGIGCWMYLDASFAHQGTWVFEGNLAKMMAADKKEAT